MRIREAIHADLPDVLALMRELNPDDPPLDGARAAQRWDQLLAQPGAAVYVAEVDGMLAASCTVCVIPNLTRDGRPYALIENVVTLASHRRRGLGRAVLGAACGFAWRADCYKIMLSTSARTPGVLAFYRDCGFRDDIKTAFVATPV
ncbi:Ribosomal protein S18 acetylase RimI [Andreprevotia lacus DSM 23236]|jgi:GNAT superfamily N-acetyltransferase|uniref:Ribosomal protein S18 acetylase RimI n=1 Tax=Andreprevotia lacus DSM 23236 TaxID=1121001 RepID=A0A1W1WYD6_9NEIS|nr:GNAT family N-acetyltransferase [Andreprevotia lacus]SMC16613.1 Ribosomal protein S18 acetylase RimI [Andreprevotia lacus DSM 23236]